MVISTTLAIRQRITHGIRCLRFAAPVRRIASLGGPPDRDFAWFNTTQFRNPLLLP